MSTLHNGHVSGTSRYVTGKCRRCDKILCNGCPLKHEGRARSDGWYALQVSAWMRTTMLGDLQIKNIDIHIHIGQLWWSWLTIQGYASNNTWIHSMEATICLKGIMCKDPHYGPSQPNKNDDKYGPMVESQPFLQRKHVYIINNS